MNDMNQWLHSADAGPPDADRLEAQLAASPARAGLQALRRELEPASARLSDDLAELFTHNYGTHRWSGASRRAVHAPRRWRAVAAFAASLIAVAAVWSLRHERIPAHTPTAAAGLPDRIFVGFDEKSVAQGKASAGDRIFRGNFLPDEIFNSSRKHEG